MRTLVVGANHGFTYHDIEKALRQAKVKNIGLELHVIGTGTRGFDRLVIQYGENNNTPCTAHGMISTDSTISSKLNIDSIVRSHGIGCVLVFWNGTAFNKGQAAWLVAKMREIPYFIYNYGESEDEDET